MDLLPGSFSSDYPCIKQVKEKLRCDPQHLLEQERNTLSSHALSTLSLVKLDLQSIESYIGYIERGNTFVSCGAIVISSRYVLLKKGEYFQKATPLGDHSQQILLVMYSWKLC